MYNIILNLKIDYTLVNKQFKMIIYILELNNNKYYVGKTTNLEKRLDQHKNNIGSEWTKKYKFIKLVETIETQSEFEEDKYVKIYMNRYGINNVRGGSYNQIELSIIQKDNLIKELRTINNLCYRCGRNNHYVKNCYAKKAYNGNKIDKYNNKKDYNNKINKDNESNKDISDLVNDAISVTKSIYRYFKFKN